MSLLTKKQPQFWPSYLIIELTTRCNLRCLMCAINQDPRMQKGGEWYGDLSFEAFENLDRVLSKIERIDLNGHGESLLSPHFLPILEKVKQHGAYVGITTNALLMKEQLAEAIVKSRMDEIVVSIHAATPESYAEISRQGNFHTLVENLSTLNRLKAQYATDLPAIKFNFVGMKRNIAELEALVTLAGELKVREITVLPLAEYDNVRGESLDKNHDLLVAHLPPAIAMAERLNVTLTLPKMYRDIIEQAQPATSEKVPPKTLTACLKEFGAKVFFPHRDKPARDCLDPWNFFFVMQSGRTRPCCIIEENMGDLSKQQFEEIWFGEKYTKMRADILSGNPPPQCKTCINRSLTTLGALRAKVHEKVIGPV